MYIPDSSVAGDVLDTVIIVIIFLFSILTSLLLTTVTSTVYTSAVRLNTVMGLSPITATGGEQVQPLLDTVTLILWYVSNSSHDTSMVLGNGDVTMHL